MKGCWWTECAWRLVCVLLQSPKISSRQCCFLGAKDWAAFGIILSYVGSLCDRQHVCVMFHAIMTFVRAMFYNTYLPFTFFIIFICELQEKSFIFHNVGILMMIFVHAIFYIDYICLLQALNSSWRRCSSLSHVGSHHVLCKGRDRDTYKELQTFVMVRCSALCHNNSSQCPLWYVALHCLIINWVNVRYGTSICSVSLWIE